jgi:adenylosuccinate lyase
MFNFSTYISPFTWRYGSNEMRRIFSEEHKYQLWRKIWVALARAEYKAGLLKKQELNDLEKNEKNIDINRILEIEKETKHDVVAAIKEFAEKAIIGGGKIHLGATSMDIVDNTDMLRMKEALLLIEANTKKILFLLGEKIEKYADFPCIGYTHLQPAEPTTVGYRLAFYAQDLLSSLEYISFAKKIIKGKGMKGAVGTSASYRVLLKNKKITVDELEKKVMKRLNLEPVLISTQVYPRQYDFIVLNCLANLTSSMAKFAGDLRILQSPNFGEWSEPFGKKQVGSSAMPFKKNPIASENICSLSRYVASLPNIALENATLSYLERTLDDSANKRIIIPEAFLATDQILITVEKIMKGLVINEKRITYNLHLYAPFAASEAILIEAVKHGANRQEMHEILRSISLIAWQKTQEGKPNPMEELLMTNPAIKKYLKRDEIKKLLDVKCHIGNAPERALKITKRIKSLSK